MNLNVTLGEALDYATIKNLKGKKLKIDNLREEVKVIFSECFMEFADKGVTFDVLSKILTEITSLEKINERLWELEDKIRTLKESKQIASMWKEIKNFNLARSKCKNRINELVGDELEVKDYTGG